MSALPRAWRELLGLAMAAGRVAWGRRAAREALQEGRAALIVLAEDAGPAAREQVSREAARAGVPCLVAGCRLELGSAIGRPPVGVLAVTDRRLAETLEDRWKAASDPHRPARQEVEAIAARDPSLRAGAGAAHPFEGDPGLPSQGDEHRHQQPHEHHQRPGGGQDPA
ncbi:MAG: ribosomal L7Ae/L30e/S12e/Gadd45 family protein [Firmicutes bacterium]|nr:ribosomal L7Ae/L30e/S12e/Gadd45 family protein [Bacillota bacterium]